MVNENNVPLIIGMLGCMDSGCDWGVNWRETELRKGCRASVIFSRSLSLPLFSYLCDALRNLCQEKFCVACYIAFGVVLIK